MSEDAAYYARGKNSSETISIFSQELANVLWDRVQVMSFVGAVVGRTSHAPEPLLHHCLITV